MKVGAASTTMAAANTPATTQVDTAAEHRQRTSATLQTQLAAGNDLSKSLASGRAAFDTLAALPQASLSDDMCRLFQVFIAAVADVADRTQDYVPMTQAQIEAEGAESYKARDKAIHNHVLPTTAAGGYTGPNALHHTSAKVEAMMVPSPLDISGAEEQIAFVKRELQRVPDVSNVHSSLLGALKQLDAHLTSVAKHQEHEACWAAGGVVVAAVGSAVARVRTFTELAFQVDFEATQTVDKENRDRVAELKDDIEHNEEESEWVAVKTIQERLDNEFPKAMKHVEPYLQQERNNITRDTEALESGCASAVDIADALTACGTAIQGLCTLLSQLAKDKTLIVKHCSELRVELKREEQDLVAAVKAVKKLESEARTGTSNLLNIDSESPSGSTAASGVWPATTEIERQQRVVVARKNELARKKAMLKHAKASFAEAEARAEAHLVKVGSLTKIATRSIELLKTNKGLLTLASNQVQHAYTARREVLKARYKRIQRAAKRIGDDGIRNIQFKHVKGAIQDVNEKETELQRCMKIYDKAGKSGKGVGVLKVLKADVDTAKLELKDTKEIYDAKVKMFDTWVATADGHQSGPGGYKWLCEQVGEDDIREAVQAEVNQLLLDEVEAEMSACNAYLTVLGGEASKLKALLPGKPE